MGQDCARWHDGLGAYILGALDAADSAATRGHLAGCATCRADYEYLLPVRDWLASTKRHLAACRVCRADYQELLPLRPLTLSDRHRARAGRTMRDGHDRWHRPVLAIFLRKRPSR